jgi:hypothetical protein
MNPNSRSWSAIAPFTSGQLAFTLRQYDAAGGCEVLVPHEHRLKYGDSRDTSIRIRAGG